MNSDGKRRSRGAFAVLVACLVLGSVLAAPAAAADGRLVVEDVTIDDESIVDSRGDVVYLWQSETHELRVTLSTIGSDGTGHYEFCVESRPATNASARTMTCRTEEVSGNSTNTVAFSFERWPADLLGPQQVSVVVRPDTLGDEVVANETIALHVLSASADDDGDGLSNRDEVSEGTDFHDPDTDDDGLRDDFEVRTFGTDPTVADTDGDGLVDGVEVTDHGTDPTASETDGDGLLDGAEVATYGTSPLKADTDGDGLDDDVEVNTYGTDPVVADTDGDGLDDRSEVLDHGTDPNARDTDSDGLSDPLEVFTYGTNPTVIDTDGDGLVDGAEVHQHGTDPASADTDGDGLSDGSELNVHSTNPIDRDTDGDGLADGAEIERFETNPNDPDTDGDGTDDRTEAAGGLPFVPPRPGTVVVLVVTGVLGVGAIVAIRRRAFPDRFRLPVAVRPLSNVRGDGGGAEADVEGPSDGETDERPASAPALDHAPPVSNEEAVLTVLSRHGGRMRQSAIVEETGWSKSKVSRVLSTMAESGEIVKIDVGRGNIIAVPGREPERSKPPFDG